MARAMWKGTIELGEEKVGVKLYSALEEKQIHFHLLHASDRQRVQQRMVDPESGDPVPAEQIKKGYRINDSAFVLLKPSELTQLEPPASRKIAVSRCVPADAVDPQWYDRPYFLGPDGAGDAYFALHDVLARKRRVGIARWVMRKRAYSGALVPHGDHLLLVTLHDASQVIDAHRLEVPEGRALDARERALGEQLIAALEGEWDPHEFKDEYRKQVMALIDAKAHGKRLALKPLRSRKPTGDALASALKASLSKLKERAHA